MLYLLGLFLILMFAYLSMRTKGNTSVAARMERQNQLGMVFFACFGMFCAIAMGLIGPVLTCTAIGAERLRQTLHVLLMTPITSWQIVSGKAVQPAARSRYAARAFAAGAGAGAIARRRGTGADVRGDVPVRRALRSSAARSGCSSRRS